METVEDTGSESTVIRIGVSLTTLLKICKVLSISGNSLLFESTPKNDVQAIAQRLERLTPEQFAIANDVLCKVLEAFALGEQK